MMVLHSLLGFIERKPLVWLLVCMPLGTAAGLALVGLGVTL